MVGKPGYPDVRPVAKAKSRFTPEDDELLKNLKENTQLTWRQIADFFPERKSGTLQVRYCTKLKEKDAVNWTDELVGIFFEARLLNSIRIES